MTNQIKQRITEKNREIISRNQEILEANSSEGSIDPRQGEELIRYFSNNNISDFIQGETDLDEIQKKVQHHFQGILDAMVIDTENDHNTQETAKRVAKMFVREIFAGRFEEKPRVTSFPNMGYDQVYTSGPISVRSTCAHHFMPIVGKCWIGVKPGDTVVGLSKFNRLVHWVCRRPQIQEEMTQQIADLIEQEIKPQGVAVVIKAEHFCMTHRGVNEHESDMTTSIMRGVFRDEPMARQEILTLISQSKGYGCN